MLKFFETKNRPKKLIPADDRATIEIEKFFDQKPSLQGAVDIFKGRWASQLPADHGPLDSGSAALFTEDTRPGIAAKRFGGADGTLQGFHVLELGPLEAGHTYQLEKLGARVTAIEGNAEAFLKCLIVKEIYGLTSRFEFGSFVKYLESSEEQFDLIFASGVLYHMVDPINLIRLICEHSDRSFLWSHYYDPAVCQGYVSEEVSRGGFTAVYYRKDYADPSHGQFWGGLADSACWLSRQAIVDAYKHFGHRTVEVAAEEPSHPHGPCFSLVTQR